MCHTLLMKASGLPMKSVLVALWVVFALLAAGCSGDESADQNPDDPSGDQAGEFDPYRQPPPVSESGALQVIVFGMRNGQVLTMLDSPGGSQVAQISSGSNDVYFTGQAQTAPDGRLYWQVEHGDSIGWVPPRLGYPASRQNVTEDVETAFGAASAAQDNAVDTALVVSGVFSLTSPPTGINVSRINDVGPNRGYVVIDVVDVGSVGVPGVLGYRVEVMTERNDDRYEITEVWSTPMCENTPTTGSCL